MAKYELTVAADSISSGDPASDKTFTADRGMTKTTTHRVLTAKFGDGYEQRVLDGLNTKNDVFSVSFNNRTRADINLLAKFFDVNAAKAFTFTVTDHDGDTAMKVVCSSYNVNYVRDEFHSLTCEFMRVYEP